MSVGETHGVQDNAGGDAQRVSIPFLKEQAIADGVKFINVCRGVAESGFDKVCRDVADGAIGVAINTERGVIVCDTDEAVETLYNADHAGHMARSPVTGISGMLTFFAIFAVFLSTVADEIASDEGTDGIQCNNVCRRNFNLVV